MTARPPKTLGELTIDRMDDLIAGVYQVWARNPTERHYCELWEFRLPPAMESDARCSRPSWAMISAEGGWTYKGIGVVVDLGVNQAYLVPAGTPWEEG
jgi:hypothetical protein